VNAFTGSGVTFAVVFVIALGTALLLTPWVARLAARYGFAYAGRVQDLHERPTPRLGGLALYVAFGLAVAASLVLPVERRDPLEMQRLTGVLLGATVVLLLGVLDDRRPLSWLPQLAGMTLAAACPIALGVRIETIANPFGGTLLFPLWFAVPFTLFWIVGAANTVNWLDGLDGLAAGVSAIGAAAFTAHSLRIGQVSIALLPLALAGACLGFLRYNFYPARIFLGGGAYLLGYLLGTLSIIGGTKGATLLLVLGIPILDVAWQIVRRWSAGYSPTRAERGHLHHRLFALGLSQPRVVWLYYLLTAVFSVLAIGLPSGRDKLVALAGLVIVLLALLAFIARRGAGAMTKKG